ncbi:MAG: hypothetical protein A2297_01900 [Elusimicrobia bacterium RIFOXYB2_FULL_48_7]|nr:MAG: hypothetical protein A2297_01900 [Elusimicrobia bacterium RIFOXYB2_FULL_48_7]
MKKADRGYLYHSEATSICHECMALIPAKIVIKDNRVLLLKDCKVHGKRYELLEEDAEYYLKRNIYDKPGTASTAQTGSLKGCPHDCGLCPEHEQHTCIGLIEVIDKCNLNCPQCFAAGDIGKTLSLDQLNSIMDFYIESEGGQAEILQISGGEPTLHPDIIKIIEKAREKKIKYIMLNTNGIRIAEDMSFAAELGKFKGGFEIYLQFDGFEKKAQEHLRGRDMREIKIKAVENLAAYKVPVTLVSTIENGVNDTEIGAIINFALNSKYVRGINFQQMAYYNGNNDGVDMLKRSTVSGILKDIEKQTNGIIRKDDFVALPCNVERVAVTYLYRDGRGFLPITRNLKVQDFLPFIRNTFSFTTEDIMKEALNQMTEGQFCQCFDFIKGLKPLLPFGLHLKRKEKKIEYISENTFRITATSFVDAYNFDLRSLRKECVHVITSDMKRIPFSAYNLFHRRANA